MPESMKLSSVIKDSNEDINGKTELELILQPIKPVYTGTILDVEQDVNRMIYIKSSSFPLIPQLTSGFQIEKIRKALEEFQASKKQR